MHRITAGLVLFAMLAGINSACIHWAINNLMKTDGNFIWTCEFNDHEVKRHNCTWNGKMVAACWYLSVDHLHLMLL
jgi:hypothetical protein